MAVVASMKDLVDEKREEREGTPVRIRPLAQSGLGCNRSNLMVSYATALTFERGVRELTVLEAASPALRLQLSSSTFPLRASSAA